MSETPSSKQQLSEKSSLLKLQSRISSLLDSESPENNPGKMLDSIRNILKDIEDEADSMNTNGNHHLDGTLNSGSKCTMDQELKSAILKIQDFVKLLDQELSKFQGQSSDYDGLCEKTQHFSAIIDKALSNDNGLNDLVMALSVILSETGQIKFTMSRDNSNEAESNNLDCVDKVTLLENKVQTDPVKDNVSGLCPPLPRSSSDPEFEGPADAGFDAKNAVKICSPEEYEQLKSEKINLEGELAKCNEIIEETKFRLSDMEKSMEELTAKLADSEKSNSLSETQLKCMAESYKSLETRKVELENEIEVLRSKIDTLTAELTDERQSHQEDLAKYKDLEEKMER
jgi:uncharacterized coiled-coil protein SlyX